MLMVWVCSGPHNSGPFKFLRHGPGPEDRSLDCRLQRRHVAQKIPLPFLVFRFLFCFFKLLNQIFWVVGLMGPFTWVHVLLQKRQRPSLFAI